MPGNPKVIVDIITDASKAGAGIDQATGKFGKFNSAMSKMVGPAAAVVGGIAVLGTTAISAASDLQQAAGGVEAVFGDGAKQIEAWASTAATSVGLSETAYSNFAAQIGAQFKNLGVPMDQVAGQTDDLIRLGADLAATYGGTTEEAVSALSAAFRGEADPAERYGLSLSATAVNAELAAQGLTGLEGEALTAAKAQIIMAKATDQAGGAVGQFSRESDTLSGQQQTLNAQLTNTAAALGTALLPVITPVVAALADFAKWIQENTTLVSVIIGIIGALAAIVLVYAAAQWVANAAMLANPVGLIIAAIVLLIAAIAALVIWVANHTKEIGEFFTSMWEGVMQVVGAVGNWFKSLWTTIANFFKSVWQAAVNVVVAIFRYWQGLINGVINGVRSVVGTVANWFKSVWESAVRGVEAVIKTLQGVFTSVFNAIMVPIKAVIGFFGDIVSAIQNVINWLGRIKIPDVFGAIGDFFGGSQSVAAAAPASGVSAFAGPVVSGRALTAVPSPTYYGAGSGGGTVINVSGGLDSADTIARRIRSLLESRDRREGGVRIVRATR